MKTGGRFRKTGSKPVVCATIDGEVLRQASLAASHKVSVSSFGC